MNKVIRNSVLALSDLGVMPTEEVAIENIDADYSEIIDNFHNLIESISKPISDEEAVILLNSFNKEDDCFGIGWGVIHLIETAPGWPLMDILRESNGYCIELIKQRCVISGCKF